MENPSTVIQFIASICTATFSAATAFSPQFAIILSNIVEMKANIQDLKAVGTPSLITSLNIALLKFLTKLKPFTILPSKKENTIKIIVTII